MFVESIDKILLKFFPPPKFLVSPSFGLDISDESIKYIKLGMTKYGLRVEKYS